MWDVPHRSEGGPISVAVRLKRPAQRSVPGPSYGLPELRRLRSRHWLRPRPIGPALLLSVTIFRSPRTRRYSWSVTPPHAESKGEQVPGVAQGAIQGGRHAARMIRADLAGEDRKAFRYRDKGELATIGRSSAVGKIGRLQLSGWIAWMMWWAIHIFFLADFRRRFAVLFSWAWNSLTFQRGSRLIYEPWSPAAGRSASPPDPRA